MLSGFINIFNYALASNVFVITPSQWLKQLTQNDTFLGPGNENTLEKNRIEFQQINIEGKMN